MLWTGVEGPNKQRPFVRFLCASGFVHATVMLVMSLSARAVGGLNGNTEHLYGDIPGWFLITIVAALFEWSCWRHARDHQNVVLMTPQVSTTPTS